MNLLNSCINVLVNSFFRIFITLQIKIVKSSSKSFFICQSVKGARIPCRKIVIYWSQSETEIRKTNINMLKHNLISNQFCEYGKNIKMNVSNIYWILIWHKMNPSNIEGCFFLHPSSVVHQWCKIEVITCQLWSMKVDLWIFMGKSQEG